MINKEKCNDWARAMSNLIYATKELSDDEAEYIKQNLKIAFAELKIKELEAKDEQNRDTISTTKSK